MRAHEMKPTALHFLILSVAGWPQRLIGHLLCASQPAQLTLDFRSFRIDFRTTSIKLCRRPRSLHVSVEQSSTLIVELLEILLGGRDPVQVVLAISVMPCCT
jgi:hypothetical protein